MEMKNTVKNFGNIDTSWKESCAIVRKQMAPGDCHASVRAGVAMTLGWNFPDYTIVFTQFQLTILKFGL
jgi:hypothetical protein